MKIEQRPQTVTLPSSNQTQGSAMTLRTARTGGAIGVDSHDPKVKPDSRRQLPEFHPSALQFQDLIWQTKIGKVYRGRCNGLPAIIKQLINEEAATREAIHQMRELLFPIGGLQHDNLASFH